MVISANIKAITICLSASVNNERHAHSCVEMAIKLYLAEGEIPDSIIKLIKAAQRSLLEKA